MSSFYTPPVSNPVPVPPRTMVLHDGGPASLLACAVTREAMNLTAAGKDGGRQLGSKREQGQQDLGAVLWGAARGRAAGIVRQCELFQVTVFDAPVLALPGDMPAAQREVHELVQAVTFAAQQGFERVLWPASGALGDSLDLDRISAIVDRAVLVGRLVALDAREHGVPSIRVEAPWADFTDRQIADLLADMELPIESCWWWAVAGDAEAERERRRWLSAFEAVGWMVAGR